MIINVINIMISKKIYSNPLGNLLGDLVSLAGLAMSSHVKVEHLRGALYGCCSSGGQRFTPSWYCDAARRGPRGPRWYVS